MRVSVASVTPPLPAHRVRRFSPRVRVLCLLRGPELSGPRLSFVK